jgi:hypothetical protein
MEPNSVFPINFTPFIATPFTAVDRTGTNKNPCSRPTKKKKKNDRKNILLRTMISIRWLVDG